MDLLPFVVMFTLFLFLLHKMDFYADLFVILMQDVVNVMGGIGVLLPLLEQVCEAEQVYNGGQETSDLLGPELTSSRGPAALLLPLNKSAGQLVLHSKVL